MRRKKNRHYFILAFVVLQVSHLNINAQEKRYSPGVEKKIREVESSLPQWVQIEGTSGKQTLSERMAFYHVNGVSIAVIKDFKLEWAKGYGWADSAEKRRVTTATLFQAGSISKSINSIGVLKLVQDGKIDLDTDINTYLKRWQFPYDSLSKGRKLTTANLLSHTAGLTVHGFPGYKRGDSLPSIDKILDGRRPANTAQVRSAFEPGLKYQYSGGGTTITQLLLEDVTGKKYDVFMRENVLKPLGMKNSFYTQPPPEDKKYLLATAYYNDGREVQGKYNIYPEQAAAGLWTTATDLANYIIETQLSLKGKSNKVLSEKTTRLRLTPFIDRSSAFGVFINKKGDHAYFLHGGVDEGFVAQYYASVDSGSGVVVMANTANTAILNEIVNSVAIAYKWNGFFEPQIKKLADVSSTTLDAYVGKYKAGNATISIAKENDSLVLYLREKAKMYFTTDSDFFLMEAPGTEFSFTKDGENKVDGFVQKRSTGTVKITKIE